MVNNNQDSEWSHSQLSSYAQGNMSPEEAHRLERDMLDDPFLAEAVEGYSLAGAALNMSDMDEQWESSQQPPAGGGSSAIPYVTIGIIAVVVLGIGMSVFQQQEVSELAEELTVANAQEREQAIVYADSLEIMEIQLAHPIAEEKEIVPQVTRQEQSEIKAIAEEVAREKVQAPEAMPSLGYDTARPAMDQQVVVPVPVVFYIDDFKLADHRSDYSGDRYLSGEWMSGTAAIYERERKGITQVAELKQVDYAGILEEAMRHYAQRDYKAALLVLKRIEDKHPNDANVAFYGGLCYYNLDKSAKADSYLRRAMRHASSVFDQEAEWYLAQSLIEQGKTVQALVHLRAIIDHKGFYSKRAEALSLHL